MDFAAALLPQFPWSWRLFGVCYLPHLPDKSAEGQRAALRVIPAALPTTLQLTPTIVMTGITRELCYLERKFLLKFL